MAHAQAVHQPGAAQVTVSAEGELHYRSRPGDHLSGIARRFLQGGDSPDNLRQLARLNGLRQPDVLPVASAVRLPRDRLRYDELRGQVLRAEAATRADGSAVAAGQTVRAGDSLSTGPQGGVWLELANGSKVMIRADSQVRLERLRSATDFEHSDAVLSLTRGGVEAQVNKARGGTRFEVRSPVATLGVRGTGFRAALDETGDSRVEVLTGQVGATGKADAKAVVVDGGFGVVVDRSGRAGDVVALLPAPDVSALPARVEQVELRFQLPAQPAVAGYRGELIERVSRRQVASGRAVNQQLSFHGLPDGDYELVVRAVNAQGLEGREATHSVALRARPVAPLQMSPRASAQLWGELVPLAWAMAPPAQRYRTQVFGVAPGSTAAPASPASATAAAAPIVDELVAAGAIQAKLPPGSYLWRVASIDAQGQQGPFGLLRGFSLRAAPAGLPPAALGDRMIELNWAGEPGARYEVQLARDAAFSQLVLERQLAAAAVSFDRPAPGQYHVRVRPVVADADPAPWSPAQVIDLPAPPPPAPEPAPTWPWLLLIPLLWLL